MVVAHVGRRVTQDRATFGARMSSDDSVVFVDAPARIDDFAIDFTVGTAWSERYSTDNDQMFTIHADAGVPIAPGGSIVVQTAQRIHVPLNLYGIVVPTGSLFLDRGIILAAAKIEPAFEGHLRLRLVNTTGASVRLAIGDKLASGIFFLTETTTAHHPIRRESRIVERGPGIRHHATTWMRGHYTQLIGWFVTAAFGAVSAKLFF